MKITKEALDYIEDNFIEVDDADLVAFVREALEEPGDAYFRDEELYVTHTLAMHTPAWNLTDEYIIEQANYRAALEELEELGAEAATVGHWTYSQFECIKVPMLTEDGEITAAAVALWNIQMRLQDYPALDEELWTELEWEVNERAMKDAIDWEERQREVVFSDDQKDKIAELYWQDYYGYHEAGYIEDEKFQPIVDTVLSGDYQRHQETKLW